MEEIVEFLRNHVNGRTLYTDETSYRFENGRLLGTYSDQKTLSGMFFSDSRYIMDKFIVSRDKITDTKTGKVLKDEYSSSLYRYSLAKRKSTGEVTGVMIFLSSSLMTDSVPSESTVWNTYGLRFKDNVFCWIEDQTLYRDYLNADGKYRPVAYKAKCRLSLTDKGLVYEFKPEFFYVDPVTLERTPSASEYPVFVSKERRL